MLKVNSSENCSKHFVFCIDHGGFTSLFIYAKLTLLDLNPIQSAKESCFVVEKSRTEKKIITTILQR